MDHERIWMLNSLMTVVATSEMTEGGFTLIEQVVTPDGNPPPHVHTHEDEAFYVLEGEVEVTVDGQPKRLGAGDFAFGPRSVPHGYRVISASARMLVLATPGGIEAFFRDVGEPAASPVLPTPTPPDGPRVAATAARHGITLLV